jgi:hypothetical protein
VIGDGERNGTGPVDAAFTVRFLLKVERGKSFPFAFGRAVALSAHAHQVVLGSFSWAFTGPGEQRYGFLKNARTNPSKLYLYIF